MSPHPFDSDFWITPEQRAQFRRAGFVKLDGLLNAAVVEALLGRIEVEMQGSTGYIGEIRHCMRMRDQPPTRKSRIPVTTGRTLPPMRIVSATSR